MRTTLEQFFSGKSLQIPRYQRDYAWTTENVDDLWEDIEEALRLQVHHYIGTFILAKRPGGDEVLDVVDGQQRLTTITMLVRAFVERLPQGPARNVAEDRFLSDGERLRLTLLGDNQAFFEHLVAGTPTAPQTRGQRRLVRAYEHIRTRIGAFNPTEQGVQQWLKGIGRLQVLEFIENDQGSAIRIFETVNDRGRPLSALERIKSHLIYASNKYAVGALDDALSEQFGRIFVAYDGVKAISETSATSIELLAEKKTTEDAITRYHFCSYPSDYHDWSFTAADVLDEFLKKEIKSITGQADQDHEQAIRALLTDYGSDLSAFFEALRRLVARVQTDIRYYRILSALNLSAALYPMLVRLEMRGLLDAKVEAAEGPTLLDLIEAADVRVYKTGRRSVEAATARAARDAAKSSAQDVVTWLRWFIGQYAGDDQFRLALGAEVYRANDADDYILLEWDQAVRAAAGHPRWTIAELQAVRDEGMSIDHVLAQEPTFSWEGRGFADEEAYRTDNHRIGNLTLLETSLNSAGGKKTPEQKASTNSLYPSSRYESTRALGAEIQAKKKSFGHADIETRTKQMVEFALKRWSA